MSLASQPRWTPGHAKRRETAPDAPVMAGMAVMACVLGIASGCLMPPVVLPSRCGDGFVNERAGETCDDGNVISGDGCNADCRTSGACGDGTLDTGEACDDGNPTPGDGCSPDCRLESCGNGTLDLGETCDPGPVSTATCDSDCTPVTCGDGLANPAAGEQCDDAGMSPACDHDCTLVTCGDGLVNTSTGEECDTAGNSDTCDDDCTIARCGDGLLNPDAGETCDDGNVISGDGCNADCRTSGACGDGTLDTGEACDDGNPTPGDGCSPDCRLESCGNGTLDPGETCDPGPVSTATCDSDCTPVTCGDGLTNPAAGEQCDDAGMSATCDHDCTLVTCGDDLVNAIAGEECDTAGNSDTCDDDCTIARCGDGLRNPEAGEECDDGNRADGDGCDSACRVQLDCGNGVLDPGEDADSAPGPYPGVPVDALTCRYDFSSITQLYCGDACGNWGGGDGCQQQDADVLCKLRMDNPASTAISFTVSESLAAPGICCPPPIMDDPVAWGCVPVGVLADRGVALAISVHETDLLGSHGNGGVVTGVVCTDP